MKNLKYLSLMTKALDNAREGITISDATLPDNPLIYVNNGFLNVSGYTYDESIHKNCRYLQGKQTSPDEIKKIKEAINNKEAIQSQLINYRKNGDAFWNQLSITPIFDDNGNLTNFIGIQDDISARKEKELYESQLNRQKLITEITLSVQEKERNHIGRELHDNINQMLTTIGLFIDMAQRQDDYRDDMLVKSKQLVKDTIEEIRSLSKKLVAPIFKEVSFKQLLSDLVADMSLAAPFSIDVNQQKLSELTMSDKQKILFYRIIQEQLNNIIKYAKATHVNIFIASNEHNITLSIKDNGVGFDASKKAKGIGLKNMQNRLEIELGDMQIISSIGKGTELFIQVPYSIDILAASN